MEEKNKAKIETIVIDGHELTFESDDSLPEEDMDFVKEHLIEEFQQFLKKSKEQSAESEKCEQNDNRRSA